MKLPEFSLLVRNQSLCRNLLSLAIYIIENKSLGNGVPDEKELLLTELISMALQNDPNLEMSENEAQDPSYIRAIALLVYNKANNDGFLNNPPLS